MGDEIKYSDQFVNWTSNGETSSWWFKLSVRYQGVLAFKNLIFHVKNSVIP